MPAVSLEPNVSGMRSASKMKVVLLATTSGIAIRKVYVPGRMASL